MRFHDVRFRAVGNVPYERDKMRAHQHVSRSLFFGHWYMSLGKIEWFGFM